MNTYVLTHLRNHYRYNKGLFKIELPIEEETELEISQIFTLANLQKLQNDSIGVMNFKNIWTFCFTL